MAGNRQVGYLWLHFLASDSHMHPASVSARTDLEGWCRVSLPQGRGVRAAQRRCRWPGPLLLALRFILKGCSGHDGLCGKKSQF